VFDLYTQNVVPGTIHLYAGEEAVAVGVCSVLRKDDYITSTHRGHGHCIAKGADLKRTMAEILGKKTGYCKGKGGSMHIADLDLGILGANGIVGGGLPIAVGAGYSARLRGTRQVCVAFFGDGASNEGVFHEAMNMSSAWKLPVVFVCENNQFGVSTRIDRIVNEADLAKRAVGYRMPSTTVDGNDVLAVRQAAGEAIARARAGGGPTLIVAKTFRHRGHFEGEVITYWSKDELTAWKAKDPIKFLGDMMLASGFSQADLDRVAAEVETELEEAVEFARKSPYPVPEEALEDLFWAEEGR
ncbi:MAG: thiamine pyrophosphate-dependent dehydrogenase E1 component subunit alpha, partial [Firmicutes bacterium]|nr:thiamine pyrophosphate-dependent dehydrogenase E1 component subunit alpha [Bacillota bacterium]